jgi:hypothetical protein
MIGSGTVLFTVCITIAVAVVYGMRHSDHQDEPGINNMYKYTV